MSETLAGGVALVTGGTRGIGLAIAQRLASRGMRVVVAGQREQSVRQALEELRAAGEVTGFACDVGDPRQCQGLVEQAVAWGGQLDVLVNNAGIGIFKPFLEMSLEEWEQQIRVNLLGAFYCTRFALPHLLARKGWVINVASLASRNPFPGGTAYNASKFGLFGFSEALMLEVRQQGVRVATVLPGSVDTGFAGSAPGQQWKLSPEDVAQAVELLLAFPERALPSLLELRPSRPQK